MTNQSEEILNHIKANPGVTIEGIVSGTGWNRHLVEIAVKLMVDQGLVREIGQTDWLDFRYEAVDRDSPKTMRVEQITAQMESLVGKINQDLQLSGPVKLFDPSPFQKVATVASGIALGLVPGASEEIARYAEREQLITEIAVLANITTDEVKEFYQTHPYSLEFIEAAIRAGAKLDEEDIKRTMEENTFPGITAFPPTWADIERAQAMLTQDYTFTVTFPSNDRREIKAAYMEVDGGSLYFEDDNRETILAYGPGHWVWAERVKEEDASNG